MSTPATNAAPAPAQAALQAVPPAAAAPAATITPEPAAAAPEAPKAAAEPEKPVTTLLVDGADALPQTGTEAKQPEEGAPVVPEKYDLKLPEGSHLKASRIEEISAIAKEGGLSNESAQALLAWESQAHAGWVDAQRTEAKAKVTEWVKAVENDPEMGGGQFKETVRIANAVINDFGSESLKKALNESGLGSHPELMRIFYKIGKARSPDTLVVPGAQASPQKSLEEIMYPNMFKTQ